MTPLVKPASAKVVIFEVTSRRNYELVTSAQADDTVYVGSKKWRQQQSSIAGLQQKFDKG
jgi:hypothetical protein